MKSRTRRVGGFSLVELMVAIAILLVSALAIGVSLQAGVRVNREIQEAQILQAKAQTFVDRIVRQNFGQTYDPDPTAAQLDEVFDCNTNPGTVTIDQLSRWPAGSGGWRFSLSGFPVEGEWTVQVDRDMNGDGSIAGSLEDGKRIFRIRVLFRDKLILETSRAKEVTL